MFSIDCLCKYYLDYQHTKKINVASLIGTYLLNSYIIMNIIHTCITIRLNYPMTPLYHHNKTYVCVSSCYEIILVTWYGSTIHFIFISELSYFLLIFFLLGFAACFPFAGPAAFTKELFKFVATIRATSALGVVTMFWPATVTVGPL